MCVWGIYRKEVLPAYAAHRAQHKRVMAAYALREAEERSNIAKELKRRSGENMRRSDAVGRAAAERWLAGQ